MEYLKRLSLVLLWTLLPGTVLAEHAVHANTIRFATTTSVENSGLLKQLLPKFLNQHKYDIDLTVVGSGKALRMGRSGEVDVVLVHSPTAEQKFVSDGSGVNHLTIMRNDFIIAGPANDPAGIASVTHAPEALKIIASSGQPFISRGDDSGTNKKEISLWEKSAIDPLGEDWYLESGLGMGDTLEMAEKENAYLMIDRATFVVRNRQRLKIILEDPDNLANPYSIIAVNPEKHPTVNHAAANILIDWLGSEEGQKVISEFSHEGQQLYYPAGPGRK